MKYEVLVSEHYATSVVVDADSEKEAMDKASGDSSHSGFQSLTSQNQPKKPPQLRNTGRQR